MSVCVTPPLLMLQEVLLASILRELVGLRDERIKVLMERDKHRQAAALRKSDELFHTICEIMQVGRGSHTPSFPVQP